MNAAKVKRKPWAVLAYTVADDKRGGSSLDASAQQELKAICDAADFDQLNVAAQVDFKRIPGVFRGSLTTKPPRRRAFKTVHAEDHPLWRKILDDVQRSTLRVQAESRDLNAARGCVLEQFLQYGQQECPADCYVVFFYGHACGPMGLFYDVDVGDGESTTLRLTDLADSLGAVNRRAAIIVFRDCFMNTLETAYQLRSVGEYMIASQAEAPIAGVWPWANLMAALLPSADSIDVARAVAIQLARFLEEPANRGRLADVPYSVIDLREADVVVPPLRALVHALEAARGDSRRRPACARALDGARVGFPDNPSRPGDPALLDIPTMCENLQALGRDAVSAPARALGELVRERLVRWHHSQRDVHRGMSLYYRPATTRARERSFLEAASDEDALGDAAYYAKLALSQATGWHRIALDPLDA